MDPNQITYFGDTDARNKKVRFGIKAKDRLKHVYVIGKTGMGKSTLLENMAIQDIQNGEGLAFIDPHGGTAEKLLDYVPEHRIKDVLYFAPFDMEYPVSFNVLEDIGVDKRHLVVNGLMSTFEKIWVDAWSARMAYILNNTLLALLEYPGATLLGVNRMLADKDYRKKVVDNVKDPSVKAFWVEEFAKYTERFAAEATPAIQNKVGQFTSNPLVRNLIGQSESSFDIRKFMDERKILIINLSKGQVGEGNAKLIGSMLITKIYLAAMSRADLAESELSKLPNFYLYVDEFQSFANKSFADILSEARKYKLNLTIAHQYIEQMEEEVRNAVFGNVGTMITFRVGAFDAEVLEKEFAPTFTAEDLVNLGFAQIYLKLMIDGVSSQPFSATTMPPIGRPDITFKSQIVDSSRAQFARPRGDVEKDIQDWHDEGIKPAIPQTREEFAGGKNEGRNSRDSGSRDQRPPVEKTIPPEFLPDQHKQAFLKAAEILQEKKQVEAVPELSTTEQRELEPVSIQPIVSKQKPVSLADLSNTNTKKNPTPENMSSLKSALSQVIHKSDSVTEPKQDPVPKENPLISQKKTEPHTDGLTSQQKNEQTPRHAQIKENIPKSEPHSNGREVPEEVLRTILRMDDHDTNG